MSNLFKNINSIMSINVFFDTLLVFLLRCFNKYAKVTYSQDSEDLLISKLLKRYRGPKFYVDIGCNDPRRLSNSYWFYLRGWHGLAIDANPDVLRKFKKCRPRDICENTLIGISDSSHQFIIFEESAVSSASLESIDKWKDQSEILSNNTLVAKSLQEILGKHNVPFHFAFLSIDIEGFDIYALQSLSESNYRPYIVIVESRSPLERDKIERILSPLSYRLAANSNLNCIYILTDLS